MALFLVVAYQTEEKYGFWRITLLFFMSALGGKSPVANANLSHAQFQIVA